MRPPSVTVLRRTPFWTWAAPRQEGRSDRRRGSCSRFADRRACRRRSSCCARSSSSERSPACFQTKSACRFGNGTPSTAAASSFRFAPSTGTEARVARQIRKLRGFGDSRGAPAGRDQQQSEHDCGRGAGQRAAERQASAAQGRPRPRLRALRLDAAPEAFRGRDDQAAASRPPPSAGARVPPAASARRPGGLRAPPARTPAACRLRGRRADGGSARRARCVRYLRSCVIYA